MGQIKSLTVTCVSHTKFRIQAWRRLRRSRVEGKLGVVTLFLDSLSLSAVLAAKLAALQVMRTPLGDGSAVRYHYCQIPLFTNHRVLDHGRETKDFDWKV